MRPLFLLILTFITAIFLSGCDSFSAKKYSYAPPVSTSGKKCVARCLTGKNSCDKICLLKNPSCAARIQQDAEVNFALYKQQQQIKGQRVYKRLKDFVKVNDCRGSCHCEAAFNTCYAACGGDVMNKMY